MTKSVAHVNHPLAERTLSVRNAMVPVLALAYLNTLVIHTPVVGPSARLTTIALVTRLV